MKRTLLFLFLFTVIVFTQAQPPSGYYNTATGKSGAQLKTALYNIIKDHTALSYTALWTAFQTTDKKPDGKVWDMYSNCSFTFVTDQCGNYSSECDCYNREHSWPKSWFNDATPMYTDLFHLVPTDGKVNGMRSNYPFGEVSSPTYTSGNGSKVGPCSYPGYSGTVFEPVDEYKGDFARNYFYMATRYENVISTWHSNDPNAEAILQPNSYPVFETWFINMLLSWNTEDPVSQKEIDRNNVVYTSFQHNRNPYIDHPEYANSVWGSNTGIADEKSQIALQVYPNPASSSVSITLPPEFNQQNYTFVVYSSTGMPVNTDLTLTGDKATMNVGTLPSGFYLLRLVLNDYKTVYQARIIKK
jgi:endonuclease I